MVSSWHANAIMAATIGCAIFASVPAHGAADGETVDAAPQSGPMSVVIGVDPQQLTCFAGGLVAGEPIGAADLAERLRAGQTYHLFDLNGAQGEVVSIGLPRSEGGEGECADLWRQDLSLDPRAERVFRAAVSLPADAASPLPSTLEVLDKPLDEHVALLSDFLARREVPDPQPVVTQAIRADVDGDGSPEYILNVVRVGKEQARRGDHSIILVVRGEGAARRTFIVQEEITVEDSDYPSTLWVNTIVAILDLDGDGAAEIITEGGYLYGGGWEVIRWDGSRYEHVLFCGCDG